MANLTGAALGFVVAMVGVSAARASAPPPADPPASITLTLRTRKPPAGELVLTPLTLDPRKAAIVIVDPWNYHWCMTWTEQAGGMTPRMNKALAGCRTLGMTVCWCPTDTASMFSGWPQRQRAMAVPYLPVPNLRKADCRWTVPYGACLCGPGIACQVNYGFDGMVADLDIADSDWIVSGTAELYSLCKSRGITHLIYFGGATNICLTGKDIGLGPMYAAGLETIFARDLAFAWTTYDPAHGYTPSRGNAQAADDLDRAGIPTLVMVEELRKLHLWDDAWITEPVRITPAGTAHRPYFFEQSVAVSLETPFLENGELRYTLDGREPDAGSALYRQPIPLEQTTRLRTAAFRDGRRVSLEGQGAFVRLPALPPAPDVPLGQLAPVTDLYARVSPAAAACLWPVRANASFERKRPRIRRHAYAAGLGMRAPAYARYDLKPEYKRFVALAGVDDNMLDQELGRNIAMYPSIIFKVFLDGALAAESPVMRISQVPWRFDVAIPPGTRQIVLVCDDAGTRSPYDLGNWVDAGFVLARASLPPGKPQASPTASQACAFGTEDERSETTGRPIELRLQTRDPQTGLPSVTRQTLDPAKLGIVIVDPWNFHWCMTAAQRFGAMAPRLNKALEAARRLGIQVFWSPTDVASQYAGRPQRERALAVPLLDAPRVRRLDLRIHVGVGPCMCGPGIPCLVNYGWDGMNPNLILGDRDLIVCGMQELFSLLRQRGITHLIYMGGHTNMCLIGKPDALKNMYEAGFACCVARDLNDAFTSYDPAKGWTPDDGTARVVADIEKSGVPTIDMVEGMTRAGAWDPAWIVDGVRLTPWGARDRPYLFRASTVLTLTAPLLQDAQIRYTTDGSEPTAASPLYERPLTLTKTTEVRAVAFRGGKPVSLVGGGTYVLLPPHPPAPDIYLSELTPVKRQYPHAIWHYWPRADQSYEGAPLTIRGRTFKKGLGMLAPANELYELKPEFERFVARVGVDDGVLRKAEHGRFLAMHASVQFKVFLDGELAAESPILRISQEPWAFDVKIPTGARRIDLTLTDAGSRSPFDLGNWAEAGFITKGSAGRPVTLRVPGYWEQDGRFASYDGFAWYRCFILVPKAWAGKDLTLNVAAVDNCHEAYFNGEKVGGAGEMPPNYVNGLDTEKPCSVPAKLVRPGQWNFVAIRVYDAGGAGGFRDAAPVLSLGTEAIPMEGRWLFSTGDKAEWAKPPEGNKPPDTAAFERIDPMPKPDPR